MDQVLYMEGQVNPYIAGGGSDKNFISAYDEVAKLFYTTNKANLTALEAIELVLDGSIVRHSAGDQARVLDVIATFGPQFTAEDMRCFAMLFNGHDLNSFYRRWQIRRALKKANPVEYQKYQASLSRGRTI